jgi:hypothetical protein
MVRTVFTLLVTAAVSCAAVQIDRPALARPLDAITAIIDAFGDESRSCHFSLKQTPAIDALNEWSEPNRCCQQLPESVLRPTH